MVDDLARFGMSAEPAATVAEVLERLTPFDVLLVDIDLAAFDGLTLCRQVRKLSDIPLIGFTPSTELDRVLALEAGCDDCVDKPYRSRELVARVQALRRRAGLCTVPTLQAGPLAVKPGVREVRINGTEIEVTRKEFELLSLLMSEPDRLFTRAELMQQVWEYDDDGELTALASRTIDTHVSSLRRKLGSPDWIVTVRGVGFRFNDVSVAAAQADPTVAPRPEPLTGGPRSARTQPAVGRRPR